MWKKVISFSQELKYSNLPFYTHNRSCFLFKKRHFYLQKERWFCCEIKYCTHINKVFLLLRENGFFFFKSKISFKMRLIFTCSWNRRFNKLQIKSSNSYGSIDKRTGYILFFSFIISCRNRCKPFPPKPGKKRKRTQNTSVIIFSFHI